jgi:hypothetical protein
MDRFVPRDDGKIPRDDGKATRDDGQITVTARSAATWQSMDRFVSRGKPTESSLLARQASMKAFFIESSDIKAKFTPSFIAAIPAPSLDDRAREGV